jgi:hypothetical protein
MALPVKDSAGFDDQARCMNLTGDSSFRLYFDSPLGKNDAVESPRNHNVISLDLAFYSSAFAQHKSVARDNGSLHLSFHAKGSRKFESSLQADGFIQEAGPFTGFWGPGTF